MILSHYPQSESGRSAWAFDHQTAHANLVSGMTDSQNYTGAAYYFLNPILGGEVSNGPWNDWHQQAHDDASAYYGVFPSAQMREGTPSDQWWLFNNSWEHVALDEALLQSQG